MSGVVVGELGGRLSLEDRRPWPPNLGMMLANILAEREAELGAASLRSGGDKTTVSCLIVPSPDRSSVGALSPGVLGGGVDSNAGELTLDGDERVGFEGFEREDE